MNKAILLCFLALCVVPSLCDIWTNCGSAKDHFAIGDVQITPDPPKKGQNLTVAFKGILDEDVSAGTIDITVKYSVITLLSKTENLCTFDPAEVKCPIPKGNFGLKVSELIPGDAPPGSYTGKAIIKDQSKAEIACITFGVKL